jgi:hypothetical protein
MRSAARPWCFRQQAARVERRARGAAWRVGQRLRTAPQRGVSWASHHYRPWGQEVGRARRRRVVRRTVAPTRRRRDSTSCAQARLGGLGGVRGARCWRRRSPWSAASVGSSLAWLGGHAARSWASVRGVPGKRTRQASLRRADTSGPCWRARPPALGWPVQRGRRGGPHASMAAGRCATPPNARRVVLAAWRPTSCVASAQARPTHAATASCDLCGRSPLPAWARGVPRDRPAGVRRRHYRGPVTRQALRRR